nr:YdeI/OmpD-associated family protein [Sphingomonas sp. CFBP 13720]
MYRSASAICVTHNSRTVRPVTTLQDRVVPSSDIAVKFERRATAVTLRPTGDRATIRAGSGGFVANDFPQGTVHEAGDDLRTALRSDPAVLRRWESLTPLGRNEFLCWIEDAKQPATRQRRIERTFDEVRGGK